jgi:hypothetical protein
MSEELLKGFTDRQEEGLTEKDPIEPSVNFAERLQKVQAAFDSDNKTVEQQKVEDAAWSSEDSLAAAERFFSSVALGWGDDMQLWVQAQSESLYSGEDSKSIYERLRKEYDQRQAEFKQRQPGAYMAADIAGSVASPVNFIPGVNIAARAGMAGRAAQIAATGGRVATESAIYGAGEAGEGQRLSGAISGAGQGLVGYGVLRGTMGLGGKTVSAFTRRNIEGDLIDDAGEFVPITLAASKTDGVEGAVHTFYRDIVAPSFGGKGVIKAQEQKIVGKAEDYYKAQKAMSKEMDEGVKRKVQENKDLMSNASKALEEERKNLKSLQKTETADTLVPLKDKLQTLKKGKPEEIAGKATSDVNRTLNARRFDFRNQAFSEAMPAEANIKEIQKVLSVEDIGQRIRALDELWGRRGYSMIKGKKLRVNKNEFETSLAKGIMEDPVFKVLLPDVSSFKNNVMAAVSNVSKFRDASNRIDGDVLSTVRSRLGTFAAAAGDPQIRKAYYMAQGKIDDIIKKQLTPAQREAFESESKKWKSTVVLRDAIENTRVDPKKRGVFDESDWIKSASDNNNLDKRYGTGPLVKDAHVLETNLRTAEKAIAKRAANLAKAKARLVEKTISEHSQKLKTQLEKIDANIADKKARLRNNPQFSQEIARDTLLKQQKEAEVASLKSQLDELKQLRSSQNPSWFYTLAATGILAGFTTGGALGAGAGLAAAAGAGRILAAPTAQRIVAGQTAPQMGVQKMLQADATGRTADILARSIGRTGMLTGGQQ